MQLARALFLVATLLASGPSAGAGLFEREVVFSQADVDAALARAKPLQLSYGGLISVALNEPPTIRLDGDDGRAGIASAVDVQMPGNRPLRVAVAGRAGLRYDDQQKAFFIDDPVIDSVKIPSQRKEANPLVRQAASQLLASYFRSKPVYVLRENGNLQEKTARWLLKSVRIETGRVVAVLSPF
ncbi:DUF1439 domain-containing protein [Accumulibacter sp.]|uniref:DUF1439 domain-containing protein n=1 Tax=Accumulibacter sp. TaxID=2053492 RepID=UPI0025E5FDE2|nr:DUF1439 domain-containing protein [Accumulibacter sp.]MCM8610543.1 DUF1439 domain-containing protein [Accumulibacter sp.]MCM8634443.1 DUF1439 domain-containing protein [Accumulibacter sp.]MCM8641741.1 DUF1439 domain-containing protein [Accumulibacter sp.]